MTYNPCSELLIPADTQAPAPGALARHAIGISDATKIAETFGRSYKPVMPLYIRTPDNRTVLIVAGMGQATAAELEDCALAALEEEKKNDWRGTREAHGLPQQDTLIDNLRNLGEDSLRKIKANHRTMRQPHERHTWNGYGE